MGAKLAKATAARAPAVEERFTRPCGLYQHRNIDGKKLRKLIVEGKLAPCWPGSEDPDAADKLEECPICFLARAHGRRER